MGRIRWFAVLTAVVITGCSTADDLADPPAPGPTSSIPAGEPSTLDVDVPDPGVVCLTTEDDEGTAFDVCASDLGFPGIHGARFAGPNVAVAVVNPLAEITGRTSQGDDVSLPIMELDEVSFVVGTGLELEWIEAELDGRVHRQGWRSENGLAADPILVDEGDAIIDGQQVDWSVWFTRAEESCVVVDQSFESALCTDRGGREVATGSPRVATDDLRWCDHASHGVALAVARIDAGSDVELVAHSAEAIAATHRLPNGETLGFGLTPYDVGATDRIDFWVEIDGTRLRHAIRLPEPPPVITEYPTDCPDVPPTTEQGVPTTSPPTVTYPDT